MKVTDEEKLMSVVNSLKDAGYNPRDQIYGFFSTNEETYITRHGNAREIIKTIDKDIIRDYIEKK